MIAEVRQKSGRFLYWFAWIVEVFACVIGIAIALTVLYETNIEIETATGKEVSLFSPNSLLAALPFFMIAVVELTKIPLATAFYFSKTLLWRLIFIMALMFVAFITFETGFNGFERNFARTNLVVDKYKRELNQLTENKDELNRQIIELESINLETIESRHNQRRNELSDNYRSRIDDIEKIIRNTAGSASSLQIDALNDERKQIRADIQQLEVSRKRELENVYERYDSINDSSLRDLETQREDLQTQLRREFDSIERLEAKFRVDLNEANFFRKSGIENEYNKKLAEQQQRIDEKTNQINALSIQRKVSNLNSSLQGDIDAINTRFNTSKLLPNGRMTALSKEIANISGTSEKEISAQISLLRADRDNLQKEYNQQLGDNEKKRNRLLETLYEKNVKADTLKLSSTALSEKIVETRNLINSKVADKQVYRMAMYLYDTETAADLKKEEVGMVALVWFGSIAFIVAFTGIILAFGSLTLRYDEIRTSSPNLGTQIVKALRLNAIAWRKKAKEPKFIEKTVIKEVPVEVVKEVPVDKVVFRDVPVEVIKRELVHVPIFTNDHDLLGEDYQTGEIGEESSGHA